jgi:SWI/SNF-related matrix-associated actin-dependent regulator 1 of chromatin subfamily A
MARLTFAKNAFVWVGTPAEARAAADDLAGWCRTVQAAPGQVVYYTGTYGGDYMFNPWAALPFYDIADEKAEPQLRALAARYKSSFALDHPDSPPLPPGESLLPFQRAGVAYALAEENALIGDPMGLGKSIQAVAIANAIEARRILILCPANALFQWRDYLKRWLVPLKKPNTTFIIAGSGYGVHPTARSVICSYDRTRGQVGKRLLEHEWDLLILDEAHYLRNHDAARTRAVLGAYGAKAKQEPGIISRAKRIVALTGTYLPNRPREGYTLGRALDWESLSFMSEEAFEARFNPRTEIILPPKKGSSVHRVIYREEVGRLAELNARFRSGFMVRRAKELALPQMPPKTYSVVSVSNKETRRIVAAERLVDIDPEKLETVPPDKVGHVAALRREMGTAMVPLVVEYVAGLLESEDEPLTLFAFHRDVVTALTERLASFNPVVVTGSDSAASRHRATKTFQTDAQCRLFIGQLQAAGTAIDGLQVRCRTAIFAEPSWVPGENEQCVDRLHRLGQERAVNAVFLVADGSWNERIIKRAVSKLRVTGIALDTPLLAVG